LREANTLIQELVVEHEGTEEEVLTVAEANAAEVVERAFSATGASPAPARTPEPGTSYALN